MAGPCLVEVGIDRGIPPLLRRRRRRRRWSRSSSRCPWPSAGAVLRHAVPASLTGRIGQDVLLDLRAAGVRPLPAAALAFHERYTSGRVISRQTSDMEALNDLLDDGLDDLVTALLSMVAIAVMLLVLDLPLALVTLVAFPSAVAADAVVPQPVRRGLPARPGRPIALVIVHFVESLGGIRAVQAFRREPRNQEIFDHLNDATARANTGRPSWRARTGPA